MFRVAIGISTLLLTTLAFSGASATGSEKLNPPSEEAAIPEQFGFFVDQTLDYSQYLIIGTGHQLGMETRCGFPSTVYEVILVPVNGGPAIRSTMSFVDTDAVTRSPLGKRFTAFNQTNCSPTAVRVQLEEL